jgi:hypothetical protein
MPPLPKPPDPVTSVGIDEGISRVFVIWKVAGDVAPLGRTLDAPEGSSGSPPIVAPVLAGPGMTNVESITVGRPLEPITV